MTATLLIEFPDAQGQLVVAYQILLKFKLIQAFIVILGICENEEDPSKIKALEWSQHFSNYRYMEILQTLKGFKLLSP